MPRLLFWDVDTQVDFFEPDGRLPIPGVLALATPTSLRRIARLAADLERDMKAGGMGYPWKALFRTNAVLVRLVAHLADHLAREAAEKAGTPIREPRLKRSRVTIGHGVILHVSTESLGERGTDCRQIFIAWCSDCEAEGEAAPHVIVEFVPATQARRILRADLERGRTVTMRPGWRRMTSASSTEIARPKMR